MDMDTDTDIDETQQLIDEVGRFAQGRIAALASRPEHAMDPGQLDLLTREALALGILPVSTAEDGFGIWQRNDDPHGMRFNTGALRRIAAACPGVAFHWHRLGLAGFVAAQLGCALGGAELQGAVLVPTGHYGLARNSLATWLSAARLDADDLAMLADWLDRDAHRSTFYAQQGWSSVIWPVWIDGQLAWQHIQRSQMEVQSDLPQHGLDELSGFSCSAPLSAGKIIQADPAHARGMYARLLKMDMLGLLAAGAGALDRGQALARDYAATRKQGGKIIAQHPAVQHMLSDIAITGQNVSLALAAFARPVDQLDMLAIAAARATLSAALCHAANQVLQVHGGIGYMRDAGPEKYLRDLNMMKLAAGGTIDLRAFIAGWNGVEK